MDDQIIVVTLIISTQIGVTDISFEIVRTGKIIYSLESIPFISKYPLSKYLYKFYNYEGADYTNEVYKRYGINNIIYDDLIQYKEVKTLILRICMCKISMIYVIPELGHMLDAFKRKIKKRKKYNRCMNYVCIGCGIDEFPWQRFYRCKLCHDNTQRYCSALCYRQSHLCTLLQSIIDKHGEIISVAVPAY